MTRSLIRVVLGVELELLAYLAIPWINDGECLARSRVLPGPIDQKLQGASTQF